MLTQAGIIVSTLGEPLNPSPLILSPESGDGLGDFVTDTSRVRYQLSTSPDAPGQDLSFEQGGPRDRIFFNPSETTAAVVTCGGLCPGLNNVIRSIFLELRHNYHAKEVLGIRNGYLGLNLASNLEPVRLTDAYVDEIHKLGGTVLGTSRGPQEPSVIVDALLELRVDILFCVGGDGTQRGAHAIAAEIARRSVPIAVVGVPKTIDNDIPYVRQTFGLATALEEAQEALRCAHTEARSAVNGIGLVKLMGRHAGFIAAGASLASQDVNYVLVPEVAFPMEGEDGLLDALERRIASRGHALIAVAEGAGQHLFDGSADDRDASGNRLHHDIGLLLKDRIESHFETRGIPVSLKYIDPGYLIRSVPANTQDRLLSDRMARFAVHAAMAGKTDMLIGYWNSKFVHVPISTAVRKGKRMDPAGDLWTSVLLSTGQPRWKASGSEPTP